MEGFLKDYEEENFQEESGESEFESEEIEVEAAFQKKRSYQDFFEEFSDIIQTNFGESNINIILGNYVKQNKGIIAGNDAEFQDTNLFGKENREKIKKEIVKKTECSFSDEDSICTWIKENFAKESFFLLISLSVFHDMPYSWVKKNAELLKNRKIFEIDSESRTREILTKDELLKSIGAFVYQDYIKINSSVIEVEFIGFTDENLPKKILRVIWLQFYDYRGKLLAWMKSFAYKSEMTQSYAAIQTISFLAQLDYYYFETAMLKKLLVNCNIAGLTEILYLISQNKKYIDSINQIANQIGQKSECCYVLTALRIAQKNKWNLSKIKFLMSKYIVGTIEAIRKSESEDYMQKFPFMFVSGQNQSNYYKAMIEVVYEHGDAKKKRIAAEQRNESVQIFWMMVETDYEYVKLKKNKREMLLINMVFIENEYAQMLEELWKKLWGKNKIHIQVRELIVTYWKVKCNKNSAYERQMRAFFNKINVSKSEQQMIYKSILGGKIWME